MISVVTPSAPAPTEVSVTKPPRIMPRIIVSGATYLAGIHSPSANKDINFVLNKTAIEVKIRAMPRLNLMVAIASLDSTFMLRKKMMVASDAGILPALSNLTMRQSILPSFP